MKFILVAVFCALLGSVVLADEDEDLKKCGEETNAEYDKLCAKMNKDADKVRAVKDKCVAFPPEVDKNVIDIMTECDKKCNPCDKESMKTCGEEMFPKAEAQFQDNRDKDKKTPGSLLELYNSKKKDLVGICQKVKACIAEANK